MTQTDTSKRRLDRRILAAIVIIGLLAGVAAFAFRPATRANDAALVTLDIGFPWNAGVGTTAKLTDPLGYALHLGIAQPILEREGFRIGRQVGFNSGTLGLAALQGGGVQLVELGETPPLLAVGNGQPLRAVLLHKPNGDLWLIGRKDGPGTVRGLAGKALGAPYGSSFDKFAAALLKSEGVLDKVKLLNIAPSDSYAALRSGSIAATVATPVQAIGWQNRDPGLRVLARSRDGDPLQRTLSVTVAKDDFVRRNPRLQAALWQAYQAGVARIRSDPAAYLDFYARALGISPERAKDLVLLDYDDQPISPAGLAASAKTLEFLRSAGFLKGDVDLNKWVVR